MPILRPQTGWQKLNYDRLCKLGLDIFRDNTEWVPQMTVSHGGIRTDADGYTGIDGLFAAGTARSLEPGVYAGGYALMTTAVTGHMTGEAVAGWLAGSSAPLPEFSAGELGRMRADIFEPMTKTVPGALTPKHVLTHIQAAVFPYDVSIIKNETAMQRALAELERIEHEEIPRMFANDPHELLKLREVEAILFVSRHFVAASMERKESRAGQYRSDFPKLDPDGPAWLLINRQPDGTSRFSREMVPLDKYPVPLTRCYQNNFNFS